MVSTPIDRSPVGGPPRRDEAFRGRVLLAEDDPVNAMVVRAMLARLGCEVETVGDGRQAVEAASAEPFDLVILDARMPVLDGFGAARTLRARPEMEGVPILALTADDGAGARDRALDSGMDAHLTKPIALPELRAALDRWLPAGSVAGGRPPLRDRPAPA